MRRSVVVFVVGSVMAVVLAGCSSTPAPTGASNQRTRRLEAVVSCLDRRGWKSSITWDRQIQTDDIPTGQREIERTVSDACIKRAEAKFPLPSFDLAREKVEYRKELANRECFVKLGYSMPEPPSLQTYLDTFKSDRWLAFSAVPVGPEASYKKALETCWPPYWSE